MSEEIIYVVSGEGLIWLDGELDRVAAGDVVHVPTGTPHAAVPMPGPDLRLVCFFPHGDLSNNIEETTEEIPVQGEQT